MKDITILIAISPIPTHPSTEILDQTVASIRERLPESEIIFMFDGVPAWAEERRQAYEEFRTTMLWKINADGNSIPFVFDKHMHQSGMTREALKLVRTPVILFMEQDAPLHNEIPFEGLVPAITTGYINMLRFHFEAQVHPEHEHLMLDHEPIRILGQPYLRTRQWSQRPHLASTEYYRTICNKYWDGKPRFIEHIMYGIVVDGPYDEHRMHMYAPQGTLVRSKHLDGRRAGADVYDHSAS